MVDDTFHNKVQFYGVNFPPPQWSSYAEADGEVGAIH